MAIPRTRLLMMGVGDPAGMFTNRTRLLQSIGDPGFLSALKSIGGTALSLVPGGGVVRTAIHGGAALLARARANVPKNLPMATGGQMPMGPVGPGGALMLRPTAALIRAGVKTLAVGAVGAWVGRMASGRGGSAAQAPPLRLAPAMVGGTGMHKRRHMHATNIKALRRATRRLASFHHLAGRVEQQLSHLVRRRHPRRVGAFGRKK